MKLLQRLKSKRIGQEKERQAADWLRRQGFKILENNYHCRGGEIDLIGLDQQQNTLVFFEVKYRRSTDYGHPAEFVTAQQQQRIIRCAQHYLLKHPDLQNAAMQFDVLTLLENQNDPERIENAFGI
ncbi:YraN family protein [Thiomicrorhabdus sp. ZW0627]|uniref:YraN family protein n=1 Tax=Thiomicrorhabdus sp. ZW0627 TaxID=3039774 RepID=UPI00243649A1|nr:YraN family protein [Thiomicrorhabdus sp. ZW0627]MDG6773998.1 YraN family protein [Thiomicrorhabdus sp. ZW0627]